MFNTEALTNELRNVFEEKQALALVKVVTKAIAESQQELVKAKDFNELKEITKQIGEKINELANAQQRTEVRMGELAQAIKSLTEVEKDTREQLGGLSKSMGYALENEAFRFLPVYLQNLGLEITEKFIRTEIDGEEINLFARGKKNGKEVIIIGESDLRLTKAWKKIEQIERKVAVVQKNFPGVDIIKVLVTHYAKPAVAEKIKEKGIILLHSYEWV
jgi:DNA polymerase II large subunit